MSSPIISQKAPCSVEVPQVKNTIGAVAASVQSSLFATVHIRIRNLYRLNSKPAKAVSCSFAGASTAAQ